MGNALCINKYEWRPALQRTETSPTAQALSRPALPHSPVLCKHLPSQHSHTAFLPIARRRRRKGRLRQLHQPYKKKCFPFFRCRRRRGGCDNCASLTKNCLIPFPRCRRRRGGCDNCASRAAGAVAERDLAAEARLLLGVVARLKGFGLGKPISILRGSR